jgi:hypothetical protein
LNKLCGKTAVIMGEFFGSAVVKGRNFAAIGEVLRLFVK